MASGRPTTSRKRGFTIVEVMAAAGVMAFAITTSITVMQRSFLAVDTARNISYASQIMQCELEKMRLRPWATISTYAPSTISVTTDVTVDSSFRSNTYIGNRFTMTRTANRMHADTMMQIQLTITWRSYDGRTISRSYITYYGKDGLYDYFI